MRAGWRKAGLGIAVIAVAASGCAGARSRKLRTASELTPGFEVYAPDGGGGGWVVHRLPDRGDTLWGCPDVASTVGCKQVYLDAWRPGAVVQLLHVGIGTQRAWVVVAAPGEPDTMLACGGPERGPACVPVPLELLPPGAAISRVWPPLPRGAERDPLEVLGADDASDLWVQAGPRGPGPTNLYACTELRVRPHCELAVPNWLALDKAPLGIDKLEGVVRGQLLPGASGAYASATGVRVGTVQEGSVAWEAGLREGDIIARIGEFAPSDARHARALFAQVPAEHPVLVELGDGRRVEVVVPRDSAREKDALR
jgi:hypothetical protein